MRLNISSDASAGISMESNTHKSLLKHPIYVPTAVSQLAASIEIQKEKKVSKAQPVQKLYFGLLAGPGFNTVEKQKLTKAGLNFGVLAGYEISRAFSIETGIIWSQKFYSTSGAHFNMKIIGPAMPAGMNVMEIDGCTQVLEIPVNLRYSFLQRNKRSLYSIAGFSSYIVDKESNHYHTSMNGAAEMMYGTYKSNSGYFASSINLGIGYEQRLGKKANVRVQPYVQLPVTGIGVGDLHVMSTGLYIGITRTAH